MVLRVLCLHGFRTNKQVMQDQTRDLRRLLGPDAEFVFLNGPLEATGESDAMVERAYAAQKPFYEWWRQVTPDGVEIIDAAVAARVIQESKTRWVWEGMEDALEHVSDVIKSQGPFDILLGFSQGALLATLLTVWRHKMQLPRTWKLNMCFNGLRGHGSNCIELAHDENNQLIHVDCPSVHIFGLQDPLFEEAKMLAGHYEDCAADGTRIKLLLEHEGGHRFPSAKRHPAVYQAMLNAIVQQCSYIPKQVSIEARY